MVQLLSEAIAVGPDDSIAARLQAACASRVCVHASASQLPAHVARHILLQVEAYFTRIGILLPGWHTGYWTALRTLNTSEPRSWSYRDPFVAAFSAETYSHWGDSQPDNAQAPESCVAANWALRYQSGTPGLGAWGWDDQSCSNRLLVMCRIIRESPAQVALV